MMAFSTAGMPIALSPATMSPNTERVESSGVLARPITRRFTL